MLENVIISGSSFLTVQARPPMWARIRTLFFTNCSPLDYPHSALSLEGFNKVLWLHPLPIYRSLFPPLYITLFSPLCIYRSLFPLFIGTSLYCFPLPLAYFQTPLCFVLSSSPLSSPFLGTSLYCPFLFLSLPPLSWDLFVLFAEAHDCFVHCV